MPTRAQGTIFRASRVGAKLRADSPSTGGKIARRFTREAVNEAIYMALRGARMQIAERNMDTIIDRIGRERTAECTSIPRRRRVFGS